MYVILVYDINRKRVSKVMKICCKYLHHVQNSVFEGNLTLGQEEKLKQQLQKIINPKEDRICIYHLNSIKYVRKVEIGKSNIITEIIDND